MARCKICRDKFEPRFFLQKACFNPVCLDAWSKIDRLSKNDATRKVEDIAFKVQRKKDKHRLKELMSRGAWYQKLQVVVNKYVLHTRDKELPCCTCSTENNIKFDAGHYIAVGKNMDLRFELTNIHRQCSLQCNQFGRGMPVEYGEFIKNKYGVGHYNWLNTKFLCHKPHPTLKELFPTWGDIEDEIKRFNKLIKS